MSYKPEYATNMLNYRPAGAPPIQGFYNGDYLQDATAPLALLNINTLTLVGDSISNSGGAIDPTQPTGSQSQYSKNFVEVANSLFAHRCQYITPGPTGPGSVAAGSSGVAFALGGIYTDDILNGGYMAAAVASAANVIVVHIGTNNVNRGDTSAKIMTDLLQIWRLATRAGKRVIATTILPRDSTIITGAKLLVMNDVNLQIRANAALEPNVFLCDWHTSMLDATGAAPPSGVSTWFVDGLHPNAPGAWRMGTILAPILNSVVVDKLSQPGDWIPIVPANCITPNPFAFGNTAGVATSFTVTNVGSPTSVTPTKVARASSDLTPGEWQQIACVAATADTDGYTITITDSTTTDWVVGDILYACAEIQADAAGWDCRGFQLDVVMTGAAGVASANLISTAERTALTTGLQPAPTGGMIMVTPRIQVPASVTAVRAVLRFFGSGTIRVSRIGVRKI